MVYFFTVYHIILCGENMNLSQTQRIGLEGERYIASLLEDRGHQVKMISTWTDKLDLVVDGVLGVEVKISHPQMRRVRKNYLRPNWAFDVSRIPQDTDLLLVLICEDNEGDRFVFSVPNCLVSGKRTVRITSHPKKYQGWLKGYMNWKYLDELINFRQRKYGQLELWGGLFNRTIESEER